MQQIVDLQNDPQFQGLDVALVSIALDSTEELAAGKQEYGINGVPLLSDADKSVSEAYDVLRWAVGTGEPGHTFILVNEAGEIVWVQDYGAPDNPDSTMYVPPQTIVENVQTHLQN